MRFERIDLDRYGCFTGHTISFGPASSNGDFHIVYGPNEAGKSTLRDACIDFLYGFPGRTGYNFLHDYDLLQISATVSTDNALIEGRRIKKTTGDFFGFNGAPGSDAGLKAVLGDVSRDGFEQMFSLDDDSIEAGGEGILRSEGDLGALLFSAASGLSSLSAGIEKIQGLADTFYKPSKRNLRLTELKAKLTEIECRLRESDVSASAYVKLKGDEAGARKNHAEAKLERDRNALRMDELKAILDAVEPWCELREISGLIKPLENAPAVPEGWLEEAEGLVAAEATARQARIENERAVMRATEARNAIDIDQVALEIANAVDRLGKDLEARFRASIDIENRRREFLTIEEDIAALLNRLGRSNTDDPQELILPAGAVGEIRDLIETRGEFTKGGQSAREEWEAAEDRRKESEAAVKEIGDIGDLSAFARAIDLVRGDADTRSADEFQRQCAGLNEELDTLIAGLAPWSGGNEALMDAGIPADGDVLRLKTEARDIDTERTRLDGEINRFKDGKAGLDAEIRSLVKLAGVVESAATRTARDAAWARHRDGLDADPPKPADTLRESADIFEAAMLEDDKDASARLSRTSELAEFRRAETAHAKCDAGLTREIEKSATLEGRKTVHAKDVRTFLKKLGLPPEFEISGIDVWLERLKAAQAKARDLADAAHRRDEAQSRLENANAAIDAAMAGIGLAIDGLDGPARLKCCDEAIEKWKERAQEFSTASTAVRNARKESKRRKRTLNTAESALARWNAAWSAALGGTWIGDETPAAVKAILSELDALAGKLEKANELRGRIDDMKADRTAYRAEVKRLAEAAGENHDDDNPLGVSDRLRARVAAAQEANRASTIRKEELEDAEKGLAAARDEVDRIARRVDEMRAVVPADNLDGLIAEMRRSDEKTHLETRIARLETTLQKGLGMASAAEACAKLEETVTGDDALEAIRAEHGALMNARSDEDDHVTALYHDWKTAEDRLSTIGSDDEPARLEEQRQALLLEVEQESHAFMRLSAGVMLVNEALRAYRETHRSSMMVKASDAFARITRGAFRGLEAAPGKNAEVLVGMRADSSIVASEMSRGTRFQLYLALRIAGYGEFAKHRETLPFFADDILEPFDDDRSAETFSLLHEMSRHGQVVYLTHHPHLCEIAKTVCGDEVTIHELPDRAIMRTV